MVPATVNSTKSAVLVSASISSEPGWKRST
jgi:hypothetical protein